MGWRWYRGWGPGRGRFWGRGWCWAYPYYGYYHPYDPYGYPYDPVGPYSYGSELEGLEAYRKRLEEELREIRRKIDELKRSMGGSSP